MLYQTELRPGSNNYNTICGIWQMVPSVAIHIYEPEWEEDHYWDCRLTYDHEEEDVQ